MSSDITIHHLGVSQSERVIWLMEELELPYRLIRYERDPVTRLAPLAYKALHPMGTAPVITDGATVLGESSAIVEFILARYGEGRLAVAPNAPEFADYLYWFHFANSSLIANEMIFLVGAGLGLGADDPGLAFARQRSDKAYDLVEARLAASPFFAGDELTGADIMMVFALTTMRYFMPRDFSDRPAIRAYLRRIGERPAYRRAMEKGDPGMALLLD